MGHPVDDIKNNMDAQGCTKSYDMEDRCLREVQVEQKSPSCNFRYGQKG